MRAFASTGPKGEAWGDDGSSRGAELPDLDRIRGMGTFKEQDPDLHASFEDVLAALRNDMLPAKVMDELAEALPEGYRRELVYRWSSMDRSILTSLKEQLNLVDQILRACIDEDGSVTSGSRSGMTPKDAVNLSLRLATTFASHLPKLVKVDRVQRLESALFQVVEECLQPAERELVLRRLEEMDREVNDG